MPADIAPERLGAWLNSRDTGLSSEAIFHFMTLAVPPEHHPHDPADLGRCLRLLERFPEWKPRMPELAAHDPFWAALLDCWGEIVSSFTQEAGGSIPEKYASWRAPKTYELMRHILDGVRDRA